MHVSFESLGLSQDLLKAVEAAGFEEPSPIQALAIPAFLEGKDLIGQAQTGTGKTAAFGLPILERVDARNKSPQALILCPTRELAIQVAEEIGKFGLRKRGVSTLAVYGGQHIERQFRALERGPQIIVGTPGRIMDHMDRGTLNLTNVSMAVLDEADEMLDMGFRDDIETILEATPEGSQRVFFSATMPRAILDLAKRFLNEPEMVRIEPKMLTVPTIDQVYYDVRQHEKMDALCRVLDSQGFRKALVFCSTKRSVDEVAMHLQTRGYQSDSLHGNMAQNQRDRVMQRFRTGGVDILVATDVAARGIDVDDVDAVINYDIPNDVENYVHRIGRTGRAGRKGSAFTFVTPREQYKLRDIIRFTTAKIEKSRLPSVRDVADIRTSRLLDEVRAAMEEGGLERYAAQVEQFFDGETMENGNGGGSDLAAALLKLLMRREFGQQDMYALAEEEERRSRYEARDRGPRDGYARDRGGRPDRPVYGGPGRGDRAGKGRPRTKRPDGSAMRRSEEGMARLFFNVGSKRRVTPGDLVGAIAGETGISGRCIGAIDIREQCSFVDVPADLADTVMEGMSRAFIRGAKVSVDIAVPEGVKPEKAARN